MYVPRPVPSSPEQMSEFLMGELERLSQELGARQDLLRLGETFVAPKKPREGDIRFADGTRWNPGSGRGFYGYSSVALGWIKF